MLTRHQKSIGLAEPGHNVITRTKPGAPMSDPVPSSPKKGGTDGEPAPADEAAQVTRVLDQLLAECRETWDSDLAEEQPVGTFRVEDA